MMIFSDIVLPCIKDDIGFWKRAGNGSSSAPFFPSRDEALSGKGETKKPDRIDTKTGGKKGKCKHTKKDDKKKETEVNEERMTAVARWRTFPAVTPRRHENKNKRKKSCF